jgi:L,D-peptidoglycan transpeptidase YkuD (ErfK/YbiS/YcfS/YnhG family)
MERRLVLAGAAVALVLAVHPARSAAADSCPSTLAGALAHTGPASELITVAAPDAGATAGALSLWQRAGRCWRRLAGPWRAELGLDGLSTHHREGDGTTPEGAFGIGSVIYGVSPDPGVRYRYHRLVCGDWWDEDPASPAYNRFVHLPCGAVPSFAGGSEALWRSPGAYAYLALVDYNTDPVVPGAGSAIFLHVSTSRPTHGCVALPADELLVLLRWLRPRLAPLIVIGTAASIRSF